MAIKSKGKSRPRQAARAPKRAPVPVPQPFFARRRVQLVIVFLVGLGVFWGGVWVTNGLRADRVRTERAAAAARHRAVVAKQRDAVQGWKSAVETAVGTLAPIQDPLPPQLGADAKSNAQSILDGNAPLVSKEALAAFAGNASAAADTLDAYKLTQAIEGKGMTADQVNTILVGRTEVVQALRLYADAATLTAVAMDANGDIAKASAQAALDASASADALLSDGWRSYQLALNEVGIVTAPPGGLGSGAGLGTGS